MLLPELYLPLSDWLKLWASCNSETKLDKAMSMKPLNSWIIQSEVLETLRVKQTRGITVSFLALIFCREGPEQRGQDDLDHQPGERLDESGVNGANELRRHNEEVGKGTSAVEGEKGGVDGRNKPLQETERVVYGRRRERFLLVRALIRIIPKYSKLISKIKAIS